MKCSMFVGSLSTTFAVEVSGHNGVPFTVRGIAEYDASPGRMEGSYLTLNGVAAEECGEEFGDFQEALLDPKSHIRINGESAGLNVTIPEGARVMVAPEYKVRS